MSRLTRKTNARDYCSYCRVVELLIEREQKPKDDFYDEPEQYYERWPYQEAICGDDEERLIKLGKLEDIEEELGCPLEVVFKAIADGITITTYNIDTFERPRLYYSDDCKCYRFELAYGLQYVKLQDYGKTWCLKGEKENAN